MWYVHDHYLTCLSELRWRRDVGSCPHRLGDGCLAAIEAGLCVLRHPDQTHAWAQLEQRMKLSQSLEAADAIIVVSDYMRALLREAQPQLERASACCLARYATSASCGPVTGSDPMTRRLSPTPGGSPARRASPS